MTVSAIPSAALSFLQDRLQSISPRGEPMPLPAAMTSTQALSGHVQLDQYAIQEAVESLNARFKAWSTGLRFVIDPDTSRVIVSIIDIETGETIRQIPSEEAIHIAKELGRRQDLAFKAEA